MYASGARVYYLTDLLYLFIILTLCIFPEKKRWRNGFYVGLLVAGVWNLVWQVLLDRKEQKHTFDTFVTITSHFPCKLHHRK